MRKSLLAGLLALTAIAGAEEHHRAKLETKVRFTDKYDQRGLLHSTHLSVQPEVGLHMPLKGGLLAASYFKNHGLRDVGFPEDEVLVSYTHRILGTKLYAGAGWELLKEGHVEGHGVKGPTSLQEVQAIAGLDNSWNPRLMVAHEYLGHGQYGELGVRKHVKGLDVSVTGTGYRQYLDEGSGWGVRTQVGKPVRLGHGVTLTPDVRYFHSRHPHLKSHIGFGLSVEKTTDLW